MKRQPTMDPVEKIVRDALQETYTNFVEDPDPRALGLDFFLIDAGIFVEVKQFHSERIAGQMARAPNVIAIQGVVAAEFFAYQLRGNFAIEGYR